MISYTCLSPNHSGARNHAIDTVSIHCMAGNLTIESCGTMFAKESTAASSNYGIGSDGRIALYVDEANRSWCTSNSANDNRAVTIEVANTQASDPYPISDAAYASLIALLVDICRRNGIEKLVWSTEKNDRVNHLNGCNMTVHRDYAAKACPGTCLYNLHGQIAAEVNAKLTEDETVTLDDFKSLYKQMREELQDNDASDYSAEAREWAVSYGIIQGGSSGEFNGMWEDTLTREQMVTVLYRFAQYLAKSIKIE
ncbi:MAG: N-acetylmuramoyl-L-alanine amidase [Oscillospiraceae bacterium]|nr:N-acetylmuramoyl-L-alanine amidase [Oscillospiraceae bacterium]